MTKIALVGEAWGKDEEEQSLPFVGASGRLLNGCLARVGIVRADCLVTNVFNFRPKPSNDIKNLCGPKAEGIPGLPALSSGKFVRLEYKPELDRLYYELTKFQPTLIIALGATPCWALLGTTGIKNLRGATVSSKYGKVFPTYHPAAVLREWSLRPILLADLEKAAHEATFPEVRRPRREVWVEPTLDDLYKFEQQYILPNPDLSIDIETVGDQITCIGFAPTVDLALVVPFILEGGKNYWPTIEAEILAWKWVRHICGLKKKIVGQNFIYDMTFLWKQYGITVPHMEDDTMLLHHALQPEMEKGLGFLGSIYTSEARWKIMRDRKKDTFKKED